LVYFVVIWYIFPVLVLCTTKNLATLSETPFFNSFHSKVARHPFLLITLHIHSRGNGAPFKAKVRHCGHPGSLISVGAAAFVSNTSSDHISLSLSNTDIWRACCHWPRNGFFRAKLSHKVHPSTSTLPKSRTDFIAISFTRPHQHTHNKQIIDMYIIIYLYSCCTPCSRIYIITITNYKLCSTSGQMSTLI
jgi:hypothetical protein